METSEHHERFSAQLRMLKQRAGISFEQLAKRTGVSSSSLHRYCSGSKLPPGYGVVHAFAQACGASNEELRDLHRSWALADSLRSTQATSLDSAADARETKDHDNPEETAGNADTDSDAGPLLQIDAVPDSRLLTEPEPRPTKARRLASRHGLLTAAAVVSLAVMIAVFDSVLSNHSGAPKAGRTTKGLNATPQASEQRSGGTVDAEPPRLIQASSFRPMGTTRTTVHLSASGSQLTLSSPFDFQSLVGAYLPGSWCTTDVSFDVKLDPPGRQDPAKTGNPGAYGYGFSPQAVVKKDLPLGWSLDDRWDPPGWNDDGPGFFIAPVIMMEPDWKIPSGMRGPDVRAWHHVHAITDSVVYRIEIDGKNVGSFRADPKDVSGFGGCGGLNFRVWGGATGHFDHIIMSHPGRLKS